MNMLDLTYPPEERVAETLGTVSAERVLEGERKRCHPRIADGYSQEVHAELEDGRLVVLVSHSRSPSLP